MRQAASVTVSVPADVCFRAALAAYDDPRWHCAYEMLRPGRRYSGQVTVTEPGRRFEVSIAAVDPITKIRFRSLGYRIVYAFATGAADQTRVEIAAEYSLFAALAGLSTLGYQVGNDILHRLAGMLAFENGRVAKAV